MPSPVETCQTRVHSCSLFTYEHPMMDKKPYHDSGIDDITTMPDDVYYSDITLDQSSQDDDSDLDEFVANERLLPSRASLNWPQRKTQREHTTSTTFSRKSENYDQQPHYGSVRMSQDDLYRQQEAMDSSRPLFVSRALPPAPPVLPCTNTQGCATTSFASTKPIMPAKGILKKQTPVSSSSKDQVQQQQQLHVSSNANTSTIQSTSGDVNDVLSSRGSSGGGTMRRLKNRIRHYILAHARNNNSQSPPPCEDCPSTTSGISLITANSTNMQQIAFQKKKLRYNKMVLVQDTYSSCEYDRTPDPQSTCMRLTQEYVDEIKNEVNLYKFDEMVVHPCSRIYTHFYSI